MGSDVVSPGSLSLPLTRVRGGTVALQHAGGSGTGQEVPVKGSKPRADYEQNRLKGNDCWSAPRNFFCCEPGRIAAGH